MHRTMTFTIKRSQKDHRFYVHIDHGNGKIVLAEPHGRASKSSAFKLCDSIWQGFGYSIDPTHKLQWPPVPYGPASLKPRILS